MSIPKQKDLQTKNLHRNKLKKIAKIRMRLTPGYLLFITYAIIILFTAILKIAS